MRKLFLALMLGWPALLAAAVPASLPAPLVSVSDVAPDSPAIPSYPSAPIAPAAGRGWAASFKIPDIGRPLGKALLTLDFIDPDGPFSSVAAVDVYVMGEKPVFAASGVCRWAKEKGSVRIPLASALESTAAGDTVHLLIVPLESAASPDPIALGSAPRLDLAQAGFSWNEMMAPLWKGNRTVEESAIFFRDAADQPASARLLHRPVKIERVFSYATGKTYAEGADWKLTDGGVLIAPPGSSLPIVDDQELHPAEIPPNEKAYKANDGRFIRFNEAGWDHQKDLWITYRHQEDWEGPVPQPTENQLPRTLEKLRAKKELKLVFFGDSITSGANASAFCGFAPFLPTWAELVTKAWSAAFGAPIVMKNRALGGMDARWGAEHADFLAAGEKPDLCLIGFGMNDRGANKPPEQFGAEIAQIMAAVRQGNPDAEFILVSSMRNNPEWGPSEPLDRYREQLRKLAGPGVALVDMTAVHDALLQKKRYIDMSGNNLNHPNDYLVRWYAQMIASVLPLP